MHNRAISEEYFIWQVQERWTLLLYDMAGAQNGLLDMAQTVRVESSKLKISWTAIWQLSPCFHKRCLPWFCFNFSEVKFLIEQTQQQTSVNGSKIKSKPTYNHGQKSWDKFALLALLRTRQAPIQLHLPNLAPHPPIQCWKLVHAISTDFQHCVGWGGGTATRLQRIWQRFLHTSVLKHR